MIYYFNFKGNFVFLNMSNIKELDDYIIQTTIGKGTFGKVNLGIHKLTNEAVAIKIL